MKSQFLKFFSEQDWRANQALQVKAKMRSASICRVWTYRTCCNDVQWYQSAVSLRTLQCLEGFGGTKPGVSQAEISKLCDDLAPSLMAEPESLEATAERYVRPELRQIMMNLCRQPVSAYLERFAFRSDLLKAMYAVTDGFSGLTGSWYAFKMLYH